MSPETPNPTPEIIHNPPPTPKTRRPRNTINRKHLDELANSRAVATAALAPANTTALTAVEFDATLPTQINALATSIETAIGKLTGKRVTKIEMTAEQTTARDALIAVIAPIQTAAKRKFSGNQEVLRHAYFIGEQLAKETLEEVHAAAVAIHDRLVIIAPATAPVDVLLGIKAPQIAALTAAIGLYDNKNTTQSQQQNQNLGDLADIETGLATLAGLRHQVQLAADQAWPWRNPGVAAIRQLFLIPTDRPLGA